VGIAAVALALSLAGREPGTPLTPAGRIAASDPKAEPVAVVEELAGPVRAGRGSDRRLLAQGRTIYRGETVETGAQGLAALTITAGRARLMLGADTALVFDGPAEVRANRGTIEGWVPDTAIVAFTTPHAQIVTRETGLVVAVSPTATDVRVTRGEALVERSGNRQRLKAGGSLSLAAAPPD
jgi:hypothetical protein